LPALQLVAASDPSTEVREHARKAIGRLEKNAAQPR
jgi:hypothetical protein